MATIDKNRDLMTLINVFTVKEGRQERLVEVLVEATEKVMRHIPGFISASIHRSADGTKVVNYAQWQSKEAFQSMKKHPSATFHMGQAAALADFDPIECVVVESIGD